MLQNSKEEALNQAFKGDQHVGENNIVQELTKAILGEVKRMTGNDVCCDCGAPSEWQRWLRQPLTSAFSDVFHMSLDLTVGLAELSVLTVAFCLTLSLS